jgi:ferrochelatase
LGERLREARAEGYASVLVAPLGFVAEHVETLFDLDIEAKAEATALGLGFARLPAPNLAPGLISAMEGAVRRSLAAS